MHEGDMTGVRRVSLESAEHYTWGDSCEGWHLVNHPQLSVIRELMPPGTAERRHRHQRARQFFLVLSGVAVLEAGDVEHELQAGQGLQVEPGVAHQMFNRSQEPVAFLVVSQPHSHGDRELAGDSRPAEHGRAPLKDLL
jgi:mannose-6-phosphate isomerase-like protein (cupin superfamily)